MATFIAAVGIRFIHSKAINIGIIAGVATNVYLWLFVPAIFWFWWNVIGAVVTIAMAALASVLLPASSRYADEDISVNGWEMDWPKAGLLLGFFIFIVWISVKVPVLFGM